MNARSIKFIAAALVVGTIATACSSEAEPDEIVLLTHDSFALSPGVLNAFTVETGVSVVHITGGDAGTMINQAVLTKDNPIADVIFGVDNTFISRAVANNLFVPYLASAIETVSEDQRLEEDWATPITFGDVCVNFHISGLEDRAVSPPGSLQSLVQPEYRDLLVVQDPATSSPGLAFLAATVSAYPEGSNYDWRDYWVDLFANGVSVASDWTEAYASQFSQSGGDRPLVVSYASSPPVEVLFGELTEAPTGVMTDGCFRQIEYAGIVKGTDHEETAGKLVDFLLSKAVQEDIPLNMFVYPTNRTADLPDVFVRFTAFPDSPLIMDPDVIDDNRERWIEEWTAIARS
ncbi:MAG: thiamine ABC transporter substrate-binding protein [Actinomycetota bacterium]|nr:thiamine ABC transporter substrate-binding protein [Actinomycetota bacterium]